MTTRTALLIFFVTAALGVALHYFMFEMAYMWHVEVEQARFMRIIYFACVAAIIILWAFFPSRIAVVVVGLFGLLFPQLFFASDSKPLLGRDLSASSIAVALLGVVLLVIATQFRLLARKSR